MVIFLGLDGTCENVTPDRVFQGSNSVSEITVVAPYPATTALEIGFVLPSGLYAQSSNGSHYFPMTLKSQDRVQGINVWTYALDRSITAQNGELLIALNAITQDGNTTSFLCKQTVEESVLPNMPTVPSVDVYELIKLYIARLDARTTNVPDLVASVEKVAANAFTYTTNSGVVSAPIVLGGADGAAAMPLTPASTIRIPIAAWQPIYAANGTTITAYKTTISAAAHGQMRDGTTPDDLWIELGVAENGAVHNDFTDYTVNAAGDITVRMMQPIETIVRVWNGKGLVDVSAREMIRRETSRAIDVENDLQRQIDDINEIGIDLEARRRIDDEVIRAKNVERGMQADIDTIDSELANKRDKVTPPATGDMTRAYVVYNTGDGYMNVTSGWAGDTIVQRNSRGTFEIQTPQDDWDVHSAATKEYVDDIKTELQAAADDMRVTVDYICELIPDSASTANKLADRAFVNSSINGVAAYYITPTASGDTAFATYAALVGATTFYNGGQPRIPTQNDYAIVQADETKPQDASGKYPTTRYSYQGGTYPDGSWVFQYIVNNTTLTNAQLDAINSGITSELVGQIGARDTSWITLTTSDSVTYGDLSNEQRDELLSLPNSIIQAGKLIFRKCAESRGDFVWYFYMSFYYGEIFFMAVDVSHRGWSYGKSKAPAKLGFRTIRFEGSIPDLVALLKGYKGAYVYGSLAVLKDARFYEAPFSGVVDNTEGIINGNIGIYSWGANAMDINNIGMNSVGTSANNSNRSTGPRYYDRDRSVNFWTIYNSLSSAGYFPTEYNRCVIVSIEDYLN